jgi:hypothetical protein
MAVKNITYFMIDETPIGRIKCTVFGWTGIAYKIPRTQLADCDDIEYLKNSGVYFLFCRGENEENLAYIGQAGDILRRLKNHHKDPKNDFENWYEAVVFTTSDNSLGATEISWLENCFFTQAERVQRYEVKNSMTPNDGNPTEEKISDLENFFDTAKSVMGALGHLVFVPLISDEAAEELPEQEYSPQIDLFLERKMKNGFVIKATCKRTTEGYIVLHGSVINPKQNETTCKGVAKRARKSAKIDVNNILQENVLFDNPSAAAIFVLGENAYGHAEWKTSDGTPLKEIETNEADKLLKNDAKIRCESNGITVDGKYTFSTWNKNTSGFWANPPIDYLTTDWWLLLSDNAKRELHVFKIPANSLSLSQMKTRNTGKIDMTIFYEDNTFKDVRSKVEFANWLVKTIKY